MKPSKATQEKHLLTMITDMPVAVTFGEQVHNCARSVMSYADMAAAAGELAGYQFSLYSITSDWTPIPQTGELLTISAVQYRILRSSEDEAGVRWDMGDKYAERTGST